MSQSSIRITRSLLPLSALALTATACSVIGMGETTEAGELITGTSEIAWCDNSEEAWFLHEIADLTGPHFSLSLLCHYEGAEVPEHVASQVPALADLPETADGTDMLVNQFALAPVHDPEDEAELDAVTAWIEAGDERHELEAPPEGGGFIAVTVPSEEDAVLWVEDEGRAQGLDLRTGTHVDPVLAYYNGLSVDPQSGDVFVYEEVKVSNGSKAYYLTCGSKFLEGDRDIWREGRGWSEEGTVFLEVTFSWCTYDDLLWHLDQDASLTARSGDDHMAPLSWETTELDDGTLNYTVLFEVPADADVITFDFAPVGNVENLAGGEDYVFIETPEPIERSLTF